MSTKTESKVTVVTADTIKFGSETYQLSLDCAESAASQLNKKEVTAALVECFDAALTELVWSNKQDGFEMPDAEAVECSIDTAVEMEFRQGYEVWFKGVCNLAARHGVSIGWMTTWRFMYAEGQSAADAFYSEFEDLERLPLL